MGLASLILGESGSGKSTSLRNFDKSEVLVFNIADKVLPFRKKLNVINLRKASYSERYSLIKQYISKYQEKCKVFVIDDSQYLMAFEMFDRAKETGYNKFTDIALDFKNFLDYLSKNIFNVVKDSKNIEGDINNLTNEQKQSLYNRAKNDYKKAYNAVYAEVYEKNMAKSINLWRDLFGEEFPCYE